jgi:DNA-nicking Smr family endonuclease
MVCFSEADVSFFQLKYQRTFIFMTRNSKNKKHEQGTGVFQNTPFKTLKGITPTAPHSSPTAPKAASREEPEDDELFLRSMSGTRRIDAGHEQETDTPTSMKAGQQPGDGDEKNNRELFLMAMGALKTATFRDEAPEPEDAGHSRSPSSRMRQLKRGTLHIGEELDLHGYLKEEALQRLRHVIVSAYARGVQAVLVITGKGLNSPEGPVLPGAVAAWLREQGKGMIAEFHPAPREKGGSGAVVAFLRRRTGN